MLIAHLKYSSEIQKGMGMMKFAVNNRYLFKSGLAPVFLSIAQVFNVIFLEYLAMFVLCSMTKVMYTLATFVILMILVEFPYFVSSALGEVELKRFA